MSELKLVVENGADGPVSTRLDAGQVNPLDALNRRDVELIKRSLHNMHKDSADLRSAMIALHEKHTNSPSRSFFVSMALIWFVGFAALTIARPQLGAALHRLPGITHVAEMLR